MSATCYYCGWWTDINGVCVCGYSGKPTVRNDSCMAWKPQTEIVTNADCIRAMTDEEIAEMFSHSGKYFCHGNGYDPHSERCDYGDECEECWLDWLRQEAAE